MKRFLSLLILVIFLVSCVPVATPQTSSQTTNDQSSVEQATDTPAPVKPGRNVTVSSTEDSGANTLRQALEDAQPGDVIVFDPVVFPPEKPVAIQLHSELPAIDCGNLTVDASNAGVILDGSQAGGEWTSGFIFNSSHNTIRGFQITTFTGPGLQITENGNFNTFGGDRAIGTGPYGQGNVIRDTSDGIALRGSDNTILGNLIGTDASGMEKWSNRNPGIFLEAAASRNVIGPDNIIAYNGTEGTGGGVEFRSTAAIGNHVTRNDIHDNSASAIFYNISLGEPVQLLQAPIILDFDLSEGMANGLACAGCTVEFFTTNENNGQVFEGSVIADASGVFDFHKGDAFSSTDFKATAYKDGQNNSPFSPSISGTARVLRIQSDNPNPRLSLPSSEFMAELPSQIGTMQYVGCEDVEYASSHYLQAVSMGYSYVRVSADWYDWPEVELTGEYSDDQITPCQAKAIDLLYQNGIQVLYTIVYWDPQLKDSTASSRFTTDEEVQRYLDYARFIVEHFKGKVTWYSILNESNLSDKGRAVRVEDYINLVRKVIPVIHEADPQAKIVIGEVTPLNEMGSLAYLKTILNSDLMPLVDGIAWHGSSGNSLEYQPAFFNSYPGWVDDIVATAHENGFTGRFFAQELHWRTPDTPQPIDGNPWFYSNAVAGKYYGRGIVFHRARDFFVGVGHEGYEGIPEVYQMVTSLTGLLAGAQPTEMQATLSTPTSDTRTAVFKLPDGSQLLAFWRDNKAVDDDPGIPQTISIPGIQAAKVTGIDPLYAFQQEMVTSQVEGALVVENYLLKDYPTFIKVSP